MAEKATKAETHYRYPKGSTDKICQNCTMFRDPDYCTAVTGYIDPLATCDLFEMDDDELHHE